MSGTGCVIKFCQGNFTSNNSYGKGKEASTSTNTWSQPSRWARDLMSQSSKAEGRHNVNQHKKLDHGCVFDFGEWVAQHHEGGAE